MKQKLFIVLATLALFFAVGLILYPLVSNYVTDKYQSTIRADYSQEIREMDKSEISAVWEAARSYNEGLFPLRFSKEAVTAAGIDYGALLNLNGSGIMGYVEVPALDVNLPIYHGTSEKVLQKGVGHLLGSSLPLGGDGCHAVLTAHSGVAGKRLFSDLDQIQIGAVFYLYVLNETLAYQVVEINKILPHETELLTAVEGKDLCTLVTCYPYGVNTHRLLVRGERIPYEKVEAIEAEIESSGITVKSTWKEQYLKGLTIGGAFACAGHGTILAGESPATGIYRQV